MAHQTRQFDIAGGSTCPAPMTRVALIALRNAGGLDVNCDYVITDHVQNRLVAGTTIHLQAVSATELSENVSVNTTYDNEAWAGIYDIDRALVLELHDNRGNVARGVNGTEVANFDWGNTAYTNVLVDSSNLNVTYGNTALIQNVRITETSTVTLTGFTGQLTNTNVDIVSNVILTNANGIWRYFEIKDNSLLNANGYTGGGDNYYNTIERTSNISCAGSSSEFILRRNTLQGAGVSHIGVSTGTLTLTTSTVDNSSIAHNNGALALSITGNCHLVSGASLSHTTGTMSLSSVTQKASFVQQATNAGAVMSISQSELHDGANVNNQATGQLNVTGTIVGPVATIQRLAGATGSMTVNYSRVRGSSQITNSSTNTGVTNVQYSEVKDSSQITNNSAVAMGITRGYVTGNSVLNTGAGSGGTISFNDFQLFGGSNVSKQAASTAGTFSISGGTIIDSNSFVNTSGTGNLTLTQCKMSGNSGISLTGGNRNYNFLRLTQSGFARATLTGTGAATDQHNELEMYARASYKNSCSGAINNVNYTIITGLSGNLNLSGTTGGFNSSRLKITDGAINKVNNPNACSIILSTISDLGTLNLTNHAASETFQHINIVNSAQMNVNRTGSGTVNTVNIYNGGTVNLLGTSGSISKLDVEQGTVTMNAGTISNVSKKMNSTLTINAGAQNNVSHWNTTNKTATTANTNRVDYLGVVSSVPIV